MTGSKNRLLVIWIMFGAFCALFAALIVSAPESAAGLAWLLLDAWVLVIDIIMLKRHGLPGKAGIRAACALGALVLISYADVSIASGKAQTFSLVTSPVLTVLSGFAAFSVFENHPEGALPLLKMGGARAVGVSTAVGLAAGLLWGALNYFLMKNNNTPVLNITAHCFLTALSPAVLEELAMRTSFYAFCVSLMRGRERTFFEKFTCWTMMILPHVLVHTPNAFISGGITGGLFTALMYVVLFGLIFAILQKKRDIASAMTAHGVVDIIRFCFFGLPY